MKACRYDCLKHLVFRWLERISNSHFNRCDWLAIAESNNLLYIGGQCNKAGDGDSRGFVGLVGILCIYIYNYMYVCMYIYMYACIA